MAFKILSTVDTQNIIYTTQTQVLWVLLHPNQFFCWSHLFLLVTLMQSQSSFQVIYLIYSLPTSPNWINLSKLNMSIEILILQPLFATFSYSRGYDVIILLFLRPQACGLFDSSFFHTTYQQTLCIWEGLPSISSPASALAQAIILFDLDYCTSGCQPHILSCTLYIDYPYSSQNAPLKYKFNQVTAYQIFFNGLLFHLDQDPKIFAKSLQGPLTSPISLLATFVFSLFASLLFFKYTIKP